MASRPPALPATLKTHRLTSDSLSGILRVSSPYLSTVPSPWSSGTQHSQIITNFYHESRALTQA
jgi:hypothetical protein